jgi:hypothetical protein
MAMLYMTDGRTKQVRPSNGVHWTMEELQQFVGGYFEITSTVDGEFMVINDMGKLKGLPLNIPATRIYVHGRRDVILGDALVVSTRLELDGPDDDNDEESNGKDADHPA